MRTQQEIKDEITALKALKPIGVSARKTAKDIAVAIYELEEKYDEESDEWLALTDEQLDIVSLIREWQAGFTDEKISEGWRGLVK
jgi:DNA-directed RNA polymerase specialized sigma54-like protein